MIGWLVNRTQSDESSVRVGCENVRKRCSVWVDVASVGGGMEEESDESSHARHGGAVAVSAYSAPAFAASIFLRTLFEW